MNDCVKCLECQICNEIVLKTHYVCENGHRICSDCIEPCKTHLDFMNNFTPNRKRLRISLCGLCRSDKITKITDSLVTELHNQYNLYRDCKYCNEKVLCALYTVHLNQCKHRPYNCVYKSCITAFDHDAPTNSLISHYVTSHNFTKIEKNTKLNINIQFKNVYDHEGVVFLMANNFYSYNTEFTSDSVNFSSFDIILPNSKDKTYNVTIGKTQITLNKNNNYASWRMTDYSNETEWLIESIKT